MDAAHMVYAHPRVAIIVRVIRLGISRELHEAFAR
jgi:hypothetical protein